MRVTSNCALCQLCHRGNLHDINVIYVISLTKFTMNLVAHDSALVSRLASIAVVANFVGSVCSVTSICVTLYNRGDLQVVNVVAEKTLTKFAAN